MNAPGPGTEERAAIEEKDFAKAERLGIEFGEDFRLLEDIGWEPEHGRATVALTMPPHDLIELLRRLHGEAGCVLEGSACARLLEEEEESAKQQPESQERLRGADRAARSAQGLIDRGQRGERLPEGRGAGHREERGLLSGLRPCLGPRKTAAADLSHRLRGMSGRPIRRPGGQPEGEDQQSHGEADGGGSDPRAGGD